MCYVEPGLNLVILGQIKTKPGCVVDVRCVSAHLRTLALQDTKGTRTLRFPTKWWKLRKTCMHYKDCKVKVNVVDSRGKWCPSCLAHSTGFPTIVISKIDNGAHYSQAIVSFSGTNYKKKQKKSTRPVIVTELWRTVPFCLCLSLQSEECWHDAEKHAKNTFTFPIIWAHWVRYISSETHFFTYWG